MDNQWEDTKINFVNIRTFYLLAILAFLAYLALILLFGEPTEEEQFLIENKKKKSYLPSNIFRYKYIDIKLSVWLTGLCLDKLPDSRYLVSRFCSYNWTQNFALLNEGTLIHQDSGLCVGLKPQKPEVILMNCNNENITYFSIESKQIKVKETNYCLSLPDSESGFCMDSALVLRTCDGSISQDFENTSIKDFIQKRHFSKYLKEQYRPARLCNFPTCTLNRKTDRLKFKMQQWHNNSCSMLSSCVTVLVKTASRPHLVLRLLHSIRQHIGFDLSVVVYDDGGEDLDDDIMYELEQFSLLVYQQDKELDIGISVGRNKGLALINTTYFLLLDDDHVFSERSDVRKMLRVLETSDAAVVGGSLNHIDSLSSVISSPRLFAGELSVTSQPERALVLHIGKFRYDLSEINQCKQCDVVANMFMARTAEIKGMGGWTDELKIVEHVDFFIKLKLLGKKVVFCSGVEVFNVREVSQEYEKLRYSELRLLRYKMLFNSLYHIKTYGTCTSTKSFKNGTLKCLRYLESQHLC